MPIPRLRNPRGYDIARGKVVYAQNCAICHGENGEGQKAAGHYVFPPLWGKDSFNWGAGMHRINTAAAFIKENMPLGKGGTLSDDDAWHVAAFMNSHERPQDPRLVDGSIDKTRERYHANDGVNLYGVRVDGVLLWPGNELSWSLCCIRCVGFRAPCPPHETLRRRFPGHFVLGLEFEVRCIVALMQLRRRFAPGAIDLAAALHRRAGEDFLRPALQVGVAFDLQELARAIGFTQRQVAVPGPCGDIGDGIFVSAQIAMHGQLAVEYVHLALHLHGEAVDRVFELLWRIGVEMPEPATQVGAEPCSQNSQFSTSVRAAALLGRKCPNFSAR